MRKILGIALAFMLVLASVGVAGAFETKFSGELRTRGEVFDETINDFSDDGDRVGGGSNDTESLWDSRLRLKMDFIANDNLKAVYWLEIGDIIWGNRNNESSVDKNGKGRETNSGNNRNYNGRRETFGTDQVAVETKNLYIDFAVPSTPIRAKVGIQRITLGHGFILDDDAAALLVDINFGPATVTAFTIKEYEGQTYTNDDVDHYGLVISAPLADIGSVGIFGNWSHSADLENFSGQENVEGDGYWAGVTADLALDPITIALEIDASYQNMYGSGIPDNKTEEGYLGYLDIGAKLDKCNIGIAGLWASATSSGDTFTQISPTDPEDAAIVDWDNLFLLDITGNTLDPLGIGGGLISAKLYAECQVLDNLLTGVSVQGYWIEDEQPVEDELGRDDLNDMVLPGYIGTEVDLDVEYKIYDQLAYQIQAGYMFIDDDEDSVISDTKSGSNVEDIWFLSHKLIYTF